MAGGPNKVGILALKIKPRIRCRSFFDAREQQRWMKTHKASQIARPTSEVLA